MLCVGSLVANEHECERDVKWMGWTPAAESTATMWHTIEPIVFPWRPQRSMEAWRRWA